MRLAWHFTRLRWHLFINRVRGARHRDGLEQASRLIAAWLPAAVAAALAMAAALLGALGFTAGWTLGTRSVSSSGTLMGLRVVLAAACLLVLATTVLSSEKNRLTLHPRLLLFPIPRRVLHTLDVVSGALGDAVILTLAAGTVLFSMGLLVSGRTWVSLVALAASLGILMLLASLRSVVSLSIAWLLRTRRAAELFTLACVVMVSVGPVMLLPSYERFLQDSPLSVVGVTAALSDWSATPPELYATAIEAALARDNDMTLGALFLLGLEGTTLFVLSSWLQVRLLESPVTGLTRSRRGRHLRPFPQLLFLTPAASAIAIVQARTAFRSVRGRLILLLPGVMVALLHTVVSRIPDEIPFGRFLLSSPDAVLAFGLSFCLYTLLPFTMNQFAVDRAGLILQFLTPATDADLLRGKALGCAAIFVVQVALCAMCLSATMREVLPMTSLAVAVGALGSYAVMAPVAALASAILPVRSDISKTGTGGNPHAVAMLGGTLAIVMMTVLGCVLVWQAGRSDGGRTLLSMTGIAVGATVTAHLTLSRLVGIVAARRENLVLVAGGR